MRTRGARCQTRLGLSPCCVHGGAWTQGIYIGDILMWQFYIMYVKSLDYFLPQAIQYDTALI